MPRKIADANAKAEALLQDKKQDRYAWRKALEHDMVKCNVLADHVEGYQLYMKEWKCNCSNLDGSMCTLGWKRAGDPSCAFRSHVINMHDPEEGWENDDDPERSNPAFFLYPNKIKGIREKYRHAKEIGRKTIINTKEAAFNLVLLHGLDPYKPADVKWMKNEFDEYKKAEKRKMSEAVDVDMHDNLPSARSENDTESAASDTDDCHQDAITQKSREPRNRSVAENEIIGTGKKNKTSHTNSKKHSRSNLATREKVREAEVPSPPTRRVRSAINYSDTHR